MTIKKNFNNLIDEKIEQNYTGKERLEQMQLNTLTV